MYIPMVYLIDIDYKYISHDIQYISSQSHCYSVTKSCLTLCDPMYCSISGFPILHYVSEFVQNHVHYFGDAIQPSSSTVASVVPFCSCIQSFPASGSFLMS